MNKSISLSIRDLKTQIVGAINSSQLPPCIVEPILSVIYQQIAQAAQQEITQAEKQAEEEMNDAESN